MTKHTNCLITYQKNNGNIIMRPRLSDYGLRIGDETSMGWKVLNIHYEFDGNYYIRNDYFKMLRRKHRQNLKDKFVYFLIGKLRKLAKPNYWLF